MGFEPATFYNEIKHSNNFTIIIKSKNQYVTSDQREANRTISDKMATSTYSPFTSKGNNHDNWTEGEIKTYRFELSFACLNPVFISL